jgi:hypothetical protein
MNENACIDDLFRYEGERAEYLKANQGSLKGFKPVYGAVLAASMENDISLKAHLTVPGYLEETTLTSDIRQLLTRALAVTAPEAESVTDDHVAAARGYVTGLLGVSVGQVDVIKAPASTMKEASTGVTYACGPANHVVVVPECLPDPVGTLIYQFAIAAHYTAMRGQGSIASMISDSLTQAMVGRFVVTNWARQQAPEVLAWQLREIAHWEFAIGLGKTPTYPMGFLVSDLGVSLLKDYGDEFFKAVLNDLYDSMTDGMAMWWGTNNYYGSMLALAHLDDLEGIRRFIALDAGNKTLDTKLHAAQIGGEDVAIAANQKLGILLAQSLPEQTEKVADVI